MEQISPVLKIGEIVEVLKGRERGKYMIVMAMQERFVILADGDKRKYDQPKRKNVRHVRTTEVIAEEIIDSMKENGRVSNAKLRYVIQDYLSNHLSTEEKEGE